LNIYCLKLSLNFYFY